MPNAKSSERWNCHWNKCRMLMVVWYFTRVGDWWGERGVRGGVPLSVLGDKQTFMMKIWFQRTRKSMRIFPHLPMTLWEVSICLSSASSAPELQEKEPTFCFTQPLRTRSWCALRSQSRAAGCRPCNDSGATWAVASQKDPFRSRWKYLLIMLHSTFQALMSWWKVERYEVSSKVEKQKGAASIDCFMRRDKNTGLYLCL
jgi:hypothetical protein